MKILGRRVRLSATTGLSYAILIVVCAATLFPFAWMLSASLKEKSEIYLSHSLLPANPSLDNFALLFAEFDVPRAVWNSTWISIAATLGAVVVSTIAGYGFAKFEFPGRNRLLAVAVVTIAVPFFVIMVPLFVMLKVVFDWIDTPWPLIIPSAGSAFGIFLVRQYLLSVSGELFDAARIDGARELTIITRIVVPLASPALASLGVIQFIWHWNAFLWPRIIIRSRELETLPLLLNRIEQYSQNVVPFHLLMAASVVSVGPVFLAFALLWRKFGTDIVSGALKG